jgi:hypothetical protein
MDTKYLIISLITGPLPLEMVWALTCCFLIGFLGFVVALLLTQNRNNETQNYQNSTRNEINTHVINFLFENNSFYSLMILKNIVNKTPKNSQTIIEVLLKIKKTISFKTHQRLECLYHDLSLNKISAYKLLSNNFHIQVEGIRELKEMNNRIYANEIEKLIDHKHHLIHIEAFFATLHLKGIEGLSLLFEYKFNISEWHQMQIIKMIKNNQEISLPNFSKLYNSANLSIARFAIKLMSVFIQTLIIHKIDRILSNNETPFHVHTTSEALDFFKIPKFGEMIRPISPINNRDVQLSILYIIKEFVNKKEIILLNNILYDNYLSKADILSISELKIIEKVIKDELNKINYACLILNK